MLGFQLLLSLENHQKRNLYEKLLTAKLSKFTEVGKLPRVAKTGFFFKVSFYSPTNSQGYTPVAHLFLIDNNKQDISVSNIYKREEKLIKIKIMSNAINMNWLSSAEGESLLHHFYDNTTKMRRFYGEREKRTSIIHVNCLTGRLTW